MSAQFLVDQGKEGLCALLSRAMTLERFASVLLRPLQPITSPSPSLDDAAYADYSTPSAGAPSVGAHLVDAFVTTPFNVLASRRVALRPSKLNHAHLSWPDSTSSNWPGLSAQAYVLLAVLTGEVSGVDIPDGGMWIEKLPPLKGFVFVEEVPVTVVRRLADQGRQLAREFSGPAGPPASLLNRTVLTASRDGLTVEVPMRVIFACTALGLLPEFGASLDIPRQLRISTAPGWLRVDAPYGTLWYSLPNEYTFL